MRTEQENTMNEIKGILQSEYGIAANDITSTTGGWSAAAYKVDGCPSSTGQGDGTADTYFLKVYGKKRTSVTTQLGSLDFCMTVASWLENNTKLKGKINAPILTKNGSIKAETQDHVYLLFSYIDGFTVATTPLTIKQQEELAKIIGELHRHGADMPFDFSKLQETYEIPCAELMKAQRKMPQKADDPLCVYQQYDMLMHAIEKAQNLAEYAKSRQLAHTLCHTDIHGWNLIQSDRLILVDWESIKYTPVEADLFTLWNDWYWGDTHWGSYWGTFLPIYQKICPEYTVDEKVLKFYQIRRHIEDIEEFYKQYLYDEMTEAETNEVISCLERECKFLCTLI